MDFRLLKEPATTQTSPGGPREIRTIPRCRLKIDTRQVGSQKTCLAEVSSTYGCYPSILAPRRSAPRGSTVVRSVVRRSQAGNESGTGPVRLQSLLAR